MAMSMDTTPRGRMYACWVKAEGAGQVRVRAESVV